MNATFRIGDTVEISGAYFKNDNGYYFVVDNGAGSAGGGLWLHKLGKTGKVLKKGGCSWPLVSYCSDRVKSAEADRHNKTHAEIKPANIPLEGVAAFFRESAEELRDRIEAKTRRGWDTASEEKRLAELREVCARFEGIAAPAKKEPETGIKFYWNGIKVNGGDLIKCYYSIGDNSVNIYADGYGAELPREYFAVKNETDLYTDYHDKDSATIDEKHPLYKFVRYAALKACARDDRPYIEKTRANIEKAEQQTNKTKYIIDWIEREKQVIERRAARLAEFDAMTNPGQPTAADLEAVAQMKLAAENARKEAEKAAEIERREEYLKERSEGRAYIEKAMEENPITDGAPTVEIPFSENAAFHAWTTSEDRKTVKITVHADGTRTKEEKIIEPRRRLIMSVAAAEIVLKHFDEIEHAKKAGYDKTDFIIRWTDAETGEANIYEGRYDLGDGDGGLIAHIRSIGEYDKERAQTDEERESAENRIKTADFLQQYTKSGRIIKIEFAPWLPEFAARQKAAEEERKAKSENDLEHLAALADMFMTDEQIEHLILCEFPHGDKDKEDLARFFFHILADRDENKALDLFKRWKNGEQPTQEAI